WTRFFLAVCHLNLQQWEAARVGLNACLAQQPDFVWSYLFRSFANEKLQAFAEAESDFAEALRLDPEDEARYLLFQSRGILRFHQGDWEYAEADFRSAQGLKPEQYNAYLNLAQVYLAQSDFPAAAREVETALRLEAPPYAIAGYRAEEAHRLLAH